MRTIGKLITADMPLGSLWRLNPEQEATLEKLHIATVHDLLRHYPSRYEEPGQAKHIADCAALETVTLTGTITKSEARRAFKKKTPLGEATLDDGTGTLTLIWFHQPYMAKKFGVGAQVQVRGQVRERNKKISIINPDIEFSTGETTPLLGSPKSLAPVYPASAGISSQWFAYHIGELLGRRAHERLSDPLPDDLRARYKLPSLSASLFYVHAPQRLSDARAAQKRFAFEEVFFLNLVRLRDRESYQELGSPRLAAPESALGQFTARFPFTLTSAQARAVAAILADLARPRPMMRLLEGDVGSGKTAVAAIAAYATVLSGQEIAYMAPTEILARQHFESFIGYFAHLGVQVGLITGSECRKFPSKISAGWRTEEHTHISRAQLLKWVANGEIPILVGTHALIQKNVLWKALGLVIIDEQHRFGISQRMALARGKNAEHTQNNTKKSVPHLLTMTATPIPRTLALTIYGDLDLTLLDEQPVGRKPVITEIIPEGERERAYERMRAEIEEGRQAFIICPRIEEPDPEKELALEAKSAKSEAKRLQIDIFPEYEVGLVHGKLHLHEKEQVMKDFTEGRLHVLVSTSVIEVGVNIPNATVIAIEGAERFGLAQIHQFRGRVARSDKQAYCFLFLGSRSAASVARLKAVVNAKNGFELAEKDLQIRGAGTLGGSAQSGLSDIGMEALKNLKMVEAARAEAAKIIDSDPTLAAHPLLHERLSRTQTIHFE